MKPRMTEQEAIARLARAGLQTTEHRVRVLRAAAGTPEPFNATDIIEALRAGINRVTVYRILDLLVEHRVLNRLDLGDKPRRYCLREDDEDGHPHFHCLRCGRHICLRHGAPLLNPEALEALGLDIRNVDIRLEGFCPDCSASE